MSVSKQSHLDEELQISFLRERDFDAYKEMVKSLKEGHFYSIMPMLWREGTVVECYLS